MLLSPHHMYPKLAWTHAVPTRWTHALWINVLGHPNPLSICNHMPSMLMRNLPDACLPMPMPRSSPWFHAHHLPQISPTMPSFALVVPLPFHLYFLLFLATCLFGEGSLACDTIYLFKELLFWQEWWGKDLTTTYTSSIGLDRYALPTNYGMGRARQSHLTHQMPGYLASRRVLKTSPLCHDQWSAKIYV